jgi:hypothetical protein
MAHHDKILEHRTDCPHCGHKWSSDFLLDQLDKQNKGSLNMKCFCGNRNVIRENVNGWVVLYKYKTRIRKPKELMRITSSGGVYLEGKLIEEELLKKVFGGMLNQLKNL